MRYLVILILTVSFSVYGQTVSYEKVSADEFTSLIFRSVLVDENETVWLGTRSEGIYRWKGQDRHRLVFTDTLLSMGGAASIVSDGSGVMYFTGRNVGVLDTKANDWSLLTAEDLKSTVVFNGRSVDDVIFFSGNRGVSVLSPHEGVLFLNDSLAKVYPVVHDLILDNDQRFWLATRKGGLIVLNKEKDGWDQFFSDANCRKLFKSANGDIWIGSTHGLIHYNYAKETFDVLRLGNLLFPAFEDDKGRLWTSSESLGIWTYKSGSWIQISKEGSYGVFSAANGTTWSLSKKGLIKMD